MEPISAITGTAAPLDRSDVDTDQIIPAEWLKRVERTGFGEGLFAAWRKDPSFALNQPQYKDATILLAGANFGCGSSREHAPWALEDYGFRAVIAPSFADIFRGNCQKIGLIPVVLPEDAVRRLMHTVTSDPTTQITVDVVERKVYAKGVAGVDGVDFPLDDFTHYRLLNGLDDIGLTLRHDDAIAAYETTRPGWLPALI